MRNKDYFSTPKAEPLIICRKMAYSVKEAAELIGVSSGHLKNEFNNGKLRFVRSGRRILIMDTELRRYLEEQTIKQEIQGIID